jgi:hypothetical protein
MTSAYLNALHEEGTRDDLLREICKLYDENERLRAERYICPNCECGECEVERKRRRAALEEKRHLTLEEQEVMHEALRRSTTALEGK